MNHNLDEVIASCSYATLPVMKQACNFCPAMFRCWYAAPEPEQGQGQTNPMGHDYTQDGPQ